MTAVESVGVSSRASDIELGSPSQADLPPTPASLAPLERSSTFTSTTTTGSRSPNDSASDSNLVQRQAEFEKKFGQKLLDFYPPSKDGTSTSPEDLLTILATQAADLQSSILVHGRAYITHHHLCFRSNILGVITRRIHRLTDIVRIEKGTTAKWIQNAVYVWLDGEEDYVGYGSLINRDGFFDELMACWREGAPERYEAEMKRVEGEVVKRDALERERTKVEQAEKEESAPVEVVVTRSGSVDESDENGPGSITSVLRPRRTTCSGRHLKDMAVDAKIPLNLESTFNLLYHNKAFLKNFSEQDKKLTDVNIGDWLDVQGGGKKRILTHVMHMNNLVGPSQSDCFGSEHIILADPDKAYEIESETSMPDLPSGKNFVVHTRTCLTHDTLGDKPATRIFCTTQVDWSSSSLLKGTINPAVIKGQKEHHHQLVGAVHTWIKLHPDEFADGQGGSEATVESAPVKSRKKGKALVGSDASSAKVVKTNEEVTVEADGSKSEVTEYDVSKDESRTIVDHSRDILANPIMLAISVLCAILLLWNMKTWLGSTSRTDLVVSGTD